MSQEDQGHSAQWYDRQYDPRLPDRPMPQIIGEWLRRSHEMRAQQRPETFRYGSHERELLDLYRAPNPKGAMIFYHGGYWRSCSKDDHGWVAKDFLCAGISVAVMNYPLCPAATLGEIRTSAKRAFLFLLHEVFNETERGHLIVVGHSAGGYLAAAHAATDWTALGLPKTPFAAALAISGLFDLRPLIFTQMNAWLGLDARAAEELSISNKRPLASAPITLALGACESEEFHRQSRDLATAWPQLVRSIIDVPHRNHFNLLDELCTGGSLYQSILKMLDATRLI
ncbi:MAG: alpha/beta hydrolase [Steroidobacteraceae bacterium]